MAIEVVEEVIYHPQEHEVFLAFDSDTEAAMFHEWWVSVGQDNFVKFTEDYA